jgi:hypothetical protein
MPVIPGIMIGSFGSVFVKVQVSVKIPGLRPPDGKPAVLTGGAAEPLPEADDDEDGDEDDGAEDGVEDADAEDPPPDSDEARLTATTDETVATEAAANTTAAEAAAIANERWMNMAPVNAAKNTTGRVFTQPKQSPSTARTLG